VTITAAVPTVWFGLVAHLRERRLRLSTLKRALIGGAACPCALIDALQGEFGIEVVQGWGMTETSPVATTGRLKAKHETLPQGQRHTLQARQGRPLFGVELKIAGMDGAELPWDGVAYGELLIRGPWVASGYFRGEGGDVLRGGWFPTGDIATIDPDGYVQITDRAKDLIKSGGEWIGSIELECTAMAHPAVAEAAAIGVPHEKWVERPLLVVVLKSGEQLSRAEMLEHFQGRVAKWWVPDDVVFVESLPHTATGKLLKMALREQYRRHQWSATA
jgi:fatty-acyl-CoA synthase